MIWLKSNFVPDSIKQIKEQTNYNFFVKLHCIIAEDKNVHKNLMIWLTINLDHINSERDRP